MGYYTFNCLNCGEFTEWHKSILGQKEYSLCPECQTKSKRVYKAPLTFKMDKRLKGRIERGMEPRTVKKEALPQRKLKPSAIKPRPWQTGH